MVKGLFIILIARQIIRLLSHQILPTHSSLASISHSTPDSLHRSITLTLIPPRPIYHPFITCCVRGKSSIRAQQGFGTADSCSLSSPTTSTNCQLSLTPRDFINWNNKPKTKKHLKQASSRCWHRFSPPPLAGVKRCCVAGPHRPHPLSCRVTGSSTWNDTSASLLCCRITFSGSPLILTKETL